MSSREKPKVIWVRSLVPKEKKSACWAMWSATRAARGTSIIVPIAISSSTPLLSVTRVTTAAMRSRSRAISSWLPTSGTMISGRGSRPSRRSAAVARTIASTCMS